MVKDMELNVEDSSFRQSLSYTDKELARAAFWCVYCFDSLVSVISKTKCSFIDFDLKISLLNFDDAITVAIISTSNPFIPPISNIDTQHFYILLIIVIGKLNDLKLDDALCCNPGAIAELEMMQATLDEWKDALPPHCAEVVTNICSGTYIRDVVSTWRHVLCASMFNFVAISVRLPIIFNQIAQGYLLSTKHSCVLQDCMQFAFEHTLLLAAYISHNPTFDYAHPCFNIMVVTISIPLIIASKLTPEPCESVRIAQCIDLHLTALSSYARVWSRTDENADQMRFMMQSVNAMQVIETFKTYENLLANSLKPTLRSDVHLDPFEEIPDWCYWTL